MLLEEAFKIGGKQGKIGWAFEVEVSPSRERVSCQSAFPTLARPPKEHGGKRLEEEVEALRMSSINIFHILDISSEASNLQGITWRRQEFRKSGRKGGEGK
jgi:hypothetical protein